MYLQMYQFHGVTKNVKILKNYLLNNMSQKAKRKTIHKIEYWSSQIYSGRLPTTMVCGTMPFEKEFETFPPPEHCTSGIFRHIHPKPESLISHYSTPSLEKSRIHYLFSIKQSPNNLQMYQINPPTVSKQSPNNLQTISKQCPNNLQTMSKQSPNNLKSRNQSPNSLQTISKQSPNNVQTISKQCQNNLQTISNQQINPQTVSKQFPNNLQTISKQYQSTRVYCHSVRCHL